MTEKEEQDLKNCIKDIAAALEKKRESRRLSLEDVSHSLKIRVPLLKAIEKGKWDEVPGGVYLDNFLKKYSQFLGLDYKKLVEPYKKAKEEEKKHQDEEETFKEETEHSSRVVWVSLGVGALVLIGLLKLIVGHTNKDVVPEPIPIQEEGPALAEKPAHSFVHDIQPEALKGHTLEVFSPYPLWMRVEAEDRNFEGFIPEKTTWSWSGKGEFNVRLGHTKEVAMFLDGQKVELEENQKRVYLPNEN